MLLVVVGKGRQRHVHFKYCYSKIHCWEGFQVGRHGCMNKRGKICSVRPKSEAETREKERVVVFAISPWEASRQIDIEFSHAQVAPHDHSTVEAGKQNSESTFLESLYLKNNSIIWSSSTSSSYMCVMSQLQMFKYAANAPFVHAQS